MSTTVFCSCRISFPRKLAASIHRLKMYPKAWDVQELILAKALGRYMAALLMFCLC
jgi:hypothetical protein